MSSKKYVFSYDGGINLVDNEYGSIKKYPFDPSQMIPTQSNSYSNAYQQIMQGMLKNAQGASNKDIRRGRAFSNTDAMKASIEYAQTLEQRAYNEYLYNQYESPSAMVDQYNKAGLNPMLLAGGSSVGGSVNSSSGGNISMARGNESARGLDIFSTILQAVMGAVDLKNKTDLTQSEINLNNSAARRNNSDANLKDKDYENYDAKFESTIAYYTALTDKATAEKMHEDALRVFQEWKNTTAPTEFEKILAKYDADIELTEAQIDKYMSDIKVNDAQIWQIHLLSTKQYEKLVQDIATSKSVEDLNRVNEQVQQEVKKDKHFENVLNQIKQQTGIEDDALAMYSLYLNGKLQRGEISKKKYLSQNQKLREIAIMTKQYNLDAKSENDPSLIKTKKGFNGLFDIY